MKINGEVLLGTLGIDCGERFYPSFNTIKTWAEKCGLSKLGKRDKSLKDCCLIVDESISVNSEKLLLVLGAPSNATGYPLKASDVRVLGMSVGPSRKGQDISDEIKSVTDSTGANPSYVLGDGGRNLVSGSSLAGYTYHLDCSHTIANILKAVYGSDPDFQDLNEAIGRTRHYALSRYAYLMPPSMRSIARYMNITQWIYWAVAMNRNASIKMAPAERRMYSFLQKHASLVDELTEVMECINQVLKILKCDGLSVRTMDECIKLIFSRMMSSSTNARKVGSAIISYLEGEISKMGDSDESHIISSDIIESLFGYDKSKMSKNKRAGFTSQVLILSMKPYVENTSSLNAMDIKNMLESTTVNDVDNWRKANLMPSQMMKRAFALSA